MSLRGRLFATYFLLLFVTLAVIVGSLLVFLSARPEPPLQSYQWLHSVARGVVNELVSSALSGRVTWADLAEQVEQQGVRLLIIDSVTQEVSYDGAGLLESGTAVDIKVDDGYVAAPLTRRGGSLQMRQPLVGSFIDPSTGREWLFIAMQTQFNNNYALLSEIRSTRTLNDALSEFGSSLAIPLLQAGVIGLVFAFILAALISRQIAKPLSAVAHAAGEVAQGNYEAKLPETGASEMRAVAEAFNTMTREVRSTHQSQRDFLANVSHDLKTPLTSIQGYSQAIIDGAVRDPATAAEVIYSEADRLARMVSELTDLASLQSGRVALRLDRVDIAQLTRALTERIEVVARKKNVVMNIRAPESIVVTADGDRMAQVITNLLSNAVKFTPEGGHIDVVMRGLDNGIEVAVRDNGIGIPQNEIARVFERFYQIDKARGPKRGTGLGLAIAKEIVSAHGGRIRAESPGEGHGTTFVVWLPNIPPSTTLVSRP
jgi:signal transduction histidine kinase